jgi:membrane protein insertase Oxa1/YidC/SpoIIIJ
LSVEYTGEKYAGISVAWLMLVGNIFTLVVVPLMEHIRSLTGNFFWSIVFVVIVLIIAFFLSIAIKEPQIRMNKPTTMPESEKH